MENPSTYFLIKSLKNGDLDSLERIYKTYYSKLYWFSKKFDLTTLEPDDFVQQTFLKVWENRDKLNEHVLLDQQIFVICRNLILNHLKRESKTIPGLKEKHLQEEMAPDELDKNSKELERMYDIIEKLPHKRKNVFLLHKISNLTYEEISESLGISKKTIANHIYLAQNFIKEKLQQS